MKAYGRHHYIDGSFDAGLGTRTGPVFNPSTGQLVYDCNYADTRTVDHAVQVAAAAARKWGSQSQARRLEVIFRMRELLRSEVEPLADLIGRENGKTLADARGEIGRAVEALEFATNFSQIMKGEYSANVGGSIDIFSMRQPLGVVACIAPFNFPVMQPLMMASLAVAVGNAVVHKPSERVPGPAGRLGELWTKAGLPNGIWNVVNGDAEAVDAIVENPSVRAISFVGSTRVGEKIYHIGTGLNKRVAAYTGGKNHMVVMPDADLDAAANAFVSAGFGSASQRCMAVSLLVAVGKNTADSLRELIVPLVRRLKVGAFDEAGVDFGPLVSAAAQKAVKEAVHRTATEGAELVVDGSQLVVTGREQGFYAGPSLADRVTTNMELWKEEIFGPIRGIMRAGDFDEAVEIVNAHQYGNGAVIFTRDGPAAHRFCRDVEAGMLGVNVPIPVPVGNFNFGGLRRSRFGDAHMFGPETAKFFTKLKTISQRWPEPFGSSEALSLAFEPHE
ncbi:MULTISPECIES: CoA-acylating methylmalonate-semialdehyde dehydrogenase [unclassified Mesorhizobium]|uniref:CoA-acylating methylmalonate-semialdehyde dehydrogenase n=1 Tax=unclassified Mesorhizobium TaxID=325217 RepID=UPI00112BD1E4|nr:MULTISPECIES: CoA-acylating methylmalonate-semialdehyde dehydrogenase [unclassified Mesorhizobium]TPL00759.1 CoA-acylating methylmalonate-semialdehyde dehydrogenase [Mesorhizobium sp. B2-4-16]TPL76980.1 CoA-acylating methylmalonate-semialdehyde dehydrogenase [Mesorhizobium sp. B2-4-3]